MLILFSSDRHKILLFRLWHHEVCNTSRLWQETMKMTSITHNRLKTIRHIVVMPITITLVTLVSAQSGRPRTLSAEDVNLRGTVFTSCRDVIKVYSEDLVYIDTCRTIGGGLPPTRVQCLTGENIVLGVNSGGYVTCPDRQGFRVIAGERPSRWIPVEQAGINSHSGGGISWCPNGSFINAIDLDAAPTSAHDSPVIGAVSCGWLLNAAYRGWATSPRWIPVEQAGINSHSGGGTPWCPNGSFITQIDLDQQSGISAHDSPVIGQVRCASLAGYSRWSSTTDWLEIGAHQSHRQDFGGWCPTGSFITQIDLDAAPRNSSSHDSPIVGRVKCSYPAS